MRENPSKQTSSSHGKQSSWWLLTIIGFLTDSKTVCFSTGVVKACAWRPVQLEFELICGSMLGSYVLRFWKIQYRKVESCCASRDIDLTSGWEKWIALWLSAAAVQAVSALLLVHVLFILVLTRLVVFFMVRLQRQDTPNILDTFNHPVAVVWQRYGSSVALIGCSMAVKGV